MEAVKTKQWHVEHPFEEHGIYISDDSTELIAKVYTEENAAFIATAPSMAVELEKLKKQNQQLIEALSYLNDHCAPRRKLNVRNSDDFSLMNGRAGASKILNAIREETKKEVTA
jgi:hypothetical protein